MSTHIDGGCGRIGRRMGLLCAFLGVGAALVMVGALNLQLEDLPSLYEILMAALFLSPLFIAAAFWGTKAGRFLCRKGNLLGLNIAIGLALAFGSIVIEVVTATFVFMVMREGEPYAGWDFLWAWAAPLFIILMYGSVPATGLGVLYGFLVKRRLDQLEPHEDATSFHY